MSDKELQKIALALLGASLMLLAAGFVVSLFVAFGA